MFLVAYPRETQEMVLDAHNRAFAFFGGVPERMVYDNPKTIVQTVLVGKAREFHPRFLMLANHYLFEPVACTPASGWGEAGFRKHALRCRSRPGVQTEPWGAERRASGEPGGQCPGMVFHPPAGLC